jgi:hypothetical protein
MDDIFIITSVINTGNHPWSYVSQRSCFDAETRFSQTLDTIQSIRNLNDNTKIMLVECSDLTSEQTNELTHRVDYFIQTYDDMEVRHACLNSTKKGYGEIKKLEKACEFILTHDIKFNRLFKISGRYFLNSQFNKSNYSQHLYTFKMYDGQNGSTVLYSVPYTLFQTYITYLRYISNFYENNPPTGIETIIPVICTPKQEISILGVSGNVAVLNDRGESDFYTA